MEDGIRYFKKGDSKFVEVDLEKHGALWEAFTEYITNENKLFNAAFPKLTDNDIIERAKLAELAIKNKDYESVDSFFETLKHKK